MIKITPQEARRELAIRELERRHADKREGLIKYLAFLFEREKGEEWQDNWHYYEIEEAINGMIRGDFNRLIINVPPGSAKTEVLTKALPVWLMGQNPKEKIIVSGYSGDLTELYSGEALNYYQSEANKLVFPRLSPLEVTAKKHWINKAGGYYHAAGAGGTIIGVRCNWFIIDDPLKASEQHSNSALDSINRWIETTVYSRLFRQTQDKIIIIMQRLHDKDLCGYLISQDDEREKLGLKRHWKVISIPAEAEKDEKHRKKGESFFPARYSEDDLRMLRESMGNDYYTQYQQQPMNEAIAKFKRGWFKYYREDNIPHNLRTFTTVDSAIELHDKADDSCIMTCGVDIQNNVYILEYNHGKFDPDETINIIFQHWDKYKPAAVGIEKQLIEKVLSHYLKKEMHRRGKFLNLEYLMKPRVKGAKNALIEGLIPFYKNGKIWHRAGNCEALETQLTRHPKNAHDDIIDTFALQQYLWTAPPKYKRPIIRGKTIKQLKKEEGLS